jgi:two-component system, NtrC family, nitrogen regulation sensor histidine kinase NtrY
MKDGKLKITPFIIAVILILLAMAAEQVYLGDFEYRFRTRRFNRILKEKEKVMDNCLKGMKPILASGEPHGSASENNLFSVAGQNGITILEYFGNKLVSWSDTDFDVPLILSDSIYLKPFIFLQNGWFLTKSVQAGSERIVGLIRIRSDYGLQNDIIRNGFVKHFRIPDNTGLSRNINSSEYHIFSANGTFLFSMLYPVIKAKTNFIHIPLILWGLAFLAILYMTLCVVRYLAGQNREISAIVVSFAVFSAIYLLVLIAKKPAVLFQTELFSPYRYTMNSLIPSLGHLLLMSILLSVLAFIFYISLKTNEWFNEIDRTKWLTLTCLLIPGALFLSLYHIVFSHLVFNSNINFETYKVLDLDIFSLTGFIILLMLFSVPFLYILTVFQVNKNSDAITFILSVMTSMVVFPVFFVKDPRALFTAALFFLTVTVLIWLIKTRNTSLFNKTVIFSVVLGLYSLLLITYFSAKKTEENVKIQLVTYSTETDPMAEHLLLDIWPLISTDSTLRSMMDVVVFEKDDVDSISDYLHERYFNGYWGNFNLNIVPCRRNDSISVGVQNQIFEDCFSFFGKKILTSGHQLTGTGFYFIDSKQGRSSYLGRIYYEYFNGSSNGLFIDLYSDIKVFQPGYSELLLDKKYHSYAKLKDYSFAKYINGELVLRTGDVPYNSTDGEYIENVTDYRFFKADSYSHSLYRNGNVTVVISRPALTFQDIIISFAYLFAIIFIFSNLVLFLVRKPFFKTPAGLNFRQKMQLSFIGILLVPFILIGFVTASLTIKQYKAKHYENLREKMNSVYMELENIIPSEKSLSSDWKNRNYASLEEVLVRLSNIFNTDINLYDPYGFLISSSRPEIYYRNLISKRMDNMAFINLFSLKKSEYLQKEQIANLEYVSAYVPYYSTDYDLIAYLNLPYFRMQSVLAREISNTIVAVINFTLLLIVIAMSLAVLISGRLTAPLALLSSRLASVELGKKSEHLSYKGSDEVGELVKQYNQMVDELDQSAQKLANSEREYAWREMAKQIAHEIKNPLTPMKLNIQQLFKSWTDGVPGFEKKLERFTKNQIEYIDNLSSIASAFSSFAKIPEANPVDVDLLEQIKTTLELFKNSDNITFRVGSAYKDNIVIRADKEQINGIFSNLIKNAIQSIPPGKEGIIKVTLENGNEKVVVSVSDNGSGIPESLKGKMFTPNFTTKSSGTGLGLSIVKRYVESAGGRIWFESETDKGTHFFIEFPLIKPEAKLGDK